MIDSDSDLHNWSELQGYWSKGAAPKDYYDRITHIYPTITVKDIENAFTELDIKSKQFFLSFYNSEVFD